MNNSRSDSPILSTGARRTLSKGMRVMNFFYKLTLALLSAINFSLIMFDKTVETIHINATYFQVMSVLIAIVPIFWSALLDSCKSINVNLPPTPKTEEPVNDKSESTEMNQTG